MKNIKEKDMYKVKRIKFTPMYNQEPEREEIGILTKNPDYNSFQVITISGEKIEIDINKEIEVSIVRNIPKASREILNSIGKKMKEKYNAEKEKEEILKKINDNIQSIDNDIYDMYSIMLKQYRKDYDKYNKDDFEAEISSIFNGMNLQHTEYFTHNMPYKITRLKDNNVYVYVDVYNEKYANEGSPLVYSEYDGELFIIDSEEMIESTVKYYSEFSLRNANYANIIKKAEELNKNNKNYNIKVSPEAFIGDKNWLHIGINIDIQFKDLEYNNESLENIENILSSLLNL